MNLSRGLMNDLDTRSLIQNNVSGRCRLSLHLVPTKRKRPDNRGKFSTSTLQGRCSLCIYIKQLGEVASVKMMKIWETQFLFVILNQRECAL